MTHIGILDPLRGLAALAVAFFHFTTSVQSDWLRAVGPYGRHGVEVFFAISGFVIPYSMYCANYQLRKHLGRFCAKRITRLEPPYLASIVLTLAVSWTIWYLGSTWRPGFSGAKPNYSAAQLLLHLGYLNTFFGYPWVNEVYWSLGIEFQYYFFVALVYPLLTARRTWVRAVVLVAMTGAGLVIPTRMLVFNYLGLFSLGTLAFQCHVGILRRSAFVPAVIVVTAITSFVTVKGLNAALAGGTTALLIVFAAGLKLPAMRLFVFLGTVSYSMYLLHGTIGSPGLLLGLKFHGGVFWESTMVAGAIGVSLAAALIFNRLVERPSKRLSSRIKYS